MSVLCRVCHVFPPHVSLFGLFPVLVKCHYELILVQPCLSNYLWLSLCIYSPVCSVWFRLVYSLLPGVPVCQPCLVLSCPAVSSLKTIIWVYSSSACSCILLVCAPWQKTRPNSKRRPFTSFCFLIFQSFLFVPVFVCPAAWKSPLVLPP